MEMDKSLLMQKRRKADLSPKDVSATLLVS